MPTVMESAASWLGGQLKTLAGKPVFVDYGEVRISTTVSGGELKGWCARHQYDVMDSEGFATSLMSYDWQFIMTDLPEDIWKFANVTVISGTEKFEAMPLGNRPWHERLDTSGKLITIHTKQVS